MIKYNNKMSKKEKKRKTYQRVGNRSEFGLFSLAGGRRGANSIFSGVYSPPVTSQRPYGNFYTFIRPINFYIWTIVLPKYHSIRLFAYDWKKSEFRIRLCSHFSNTTFTEATMKRATLVRIFWTKRKLVTPTKHLLARI